MTTPTYVEPLRAFLDDVLGDDLRRLRVMEPADPDHDAFYRDIHHYVREDVEAESDDQHCIGRDVLEERWTGGSDGDVAVEYAVYSYEDAELVMVFEGDSRATAVDFEAGATPDVGSFADHVHDIVLSEAPTER